MDFDSASINSSFSLFPGSSVTVVLVHSVATVLSPATRPTRRQRAVKTVNLRLSNKIRTLAQTNTQAYRLRNRNKTRRHRNDVIMTSLSPPPTLPSFRCCMTRIHQTIKKTQLTQLLLTAAACLRMYVPCYYFYQNVLHH